MNWGIIFHSFFIKMRELLQTLWGWFLILCSFIVNFVGDYKVSVVAVIVAVALDAFWGIWAAVKQGKYARSELIRDTFSKVVVYGLALLVIIHMEMLTAETTLGTNICAAVMCGAEFWSIAGNALIINPNLGFFRLIRSSLVGEIARKLHITEEEVKEAFEKGDKLIGKENNNGK